MSRLLVCEPGWVSIDVETSGPILAEALEHPQAEAAVRCAMLMVLSALAEGEAWPAAVLQHMAGFMASMKDEVYCDRLS